MAQSPRLARRSRPSSSFGQQVARSLGASSFQGPKDCVSVVDFGGASSPAFHCQHSVGPKNGQNLGLVPAGV